MHHSVNNHKNKTASNSTHLVSLKQCLSTSDIFSKLIRWNQSHHALDPRHQISAIISKWRNETNCSINIYTNRHL